MIFRRFSLLKSILCFTVSFIFLITYLLCHSSVTGNYRTSSNWQKNENQQQLHEINTSFGNRANVLLAFNEIRLSNASTDVTVHNLSSLPSITSLPPNSVHYLHLTLNPLPTDSNHFMSMSAYYDNRNAFYGPSVVVLGYQQRKKWSESYHCTVYYEDGSMLCIQDPTIVELADPCNKYIRYAPSISVMHVCKLPDSVIPAHVSLSIDECPHGSGRSSDKLPVTSALGSVPDGFGVCVQTPLYGKLNMQSIYEFIEVNKLLGVSRFTIYTQIKVDQFSSLSKWYGSGHHDGISIDVIQWPSVFKRSTPVHYYGELLAIHDCLYRNMHKVKYLAFIDIDEVIVPVKDSSLKDMMNRISSPKMAGYSFDNVLMSVPKTPQHLSKCDSIQVPKYIRTYQRYACEYKHPRRSKVIVHPDRVAHLDIHSICHHSSYSKLAVGHDIGVLYHYRTSVPSDCKDRKLVEAEHLYRYSQQLILQMEKRFCH